MARSTMAYIITRLRRLVYDNDSEIWTSDDDLEELLDQYRRPIRREQLDRDIVEKNYTSAFTILEGSTSSWSGDPTIAIWDDVTDDSTEVDPDSYNLLAGSFTFTADQDDVYYLDAYSYRRALHMAAVDCFLELAADPGRASVMGRGGVYHSRTSYTELIVMHRRLAGATHAKMIRVRGAVG